MTEQLHDAGTDLAAGISFDSARAEQLYRERARRLDDVIALRTPDRVPIIHYSMFWHATYAGISFRDAMYDYDKLEAADSKVIDLLEPDAVVPPHPINALGPAMEIMGYRGLEWPGHGVSDHQTYQYIDREYMSAKEYDDYIEDPSWFCFTRYLPRLIEACEPLDRLPAMAGVQHLRLVMASRYFAAAGVQEAFARMAKAGAETHRMLTRASRYATAMMARGYPLGHAAACNSPYDYFADYLRGSKGVMLDMFRNKDKLLAAMERAIPIIAKAPIRDIGDKPCRIVFLPMHWGLDGFMSPEQFKTFFWPQLRQVLMRLIDAGLTPLVLWEGDCTSRMEVIADIPKGKAIYWFERGDLFRAKEVLADTVCLRGNVPASLYNTAGPAEMRDYCRKLIEVVGKDGGFILDGAIGIPDEARTENVLEMYKTAREVGRYS
ncbi:MAG: hypothetical protein KDJ46_07445 [Rhodobiaceae bacterium]|nr:hypothetical protein [Rhodobiaceae bacterium]